MAHKVIEPFRVAFEYNTATALQAGLTELLGHAEVSNKQGYPAQLESFNKTLLPFYNALTTYVENNA